jgi:hypothetical protein
MGWNGIFAPALAAWAPNAVFATVGAWIYMRPFRSGVAPGSVRPPAEGPN